MKPSELHDVRQQQGDGGFLALAPGKVTISTSTYVKEVMVDSPVIG